MLIISHYFQRIKTAGMPVLFFSASFAILASAQFGSLTGPGLVAAGLGIFLALAGKFDGAGLVGILAAAGSFGLQAMIAICPTCTFAATAFALGGIACLLNSLHNRPFMIPALAAILLGSLACYSLQGYIDERLFARPASANYMQSSTGQKADDTAASATGDGKARFYLSPTCPSCKELVPLFITADPQGQYWQPVIVPVGYLDEGRQYLAECGYGGTVLAEQAAPDNIVPALAADGATFNGRTAIEASAFYEKQID